MERRGMKEGWVNRGDTEGGRREGQTEDGRTDEGRGGYRPQGAERPRVPPKFTGSPEEWKGRGMPHEGFLAQDVLSLTPPVITPAAKEGKEVQVPGSRWAGEDPSAPRAMPTRFKEWKLLRLVETERGMYPLELVLCHPERTRPRHCHQRNLLSFLYFYNYVPTALERGFCKRWPATGLVLQTPHAHV